MRLAFVTDIHDDERIHGWLARAVRDYDIVGIGGDIGRGVIEGVIDTVKKNENAFLVFGNHDFPLTTNCPRVLHGTTAKFKGLTIGGIGGSLPVGGWPFELDDTEYLIVTRNMGPVDILLSHQPPYNTKTDILWSGRHIGSVAIRKYIDETQPRLACVGHIHESQGTERIGKTLLANPGPFYENNYLEATIGKRTTGTIHHINQIE